MTASQFAKAHQDRIRQYHTYWNLRFTAIPVDQLDGLSREERHLLHRSLATPGDLVGSTYYIARVNGSWVWVRVSDHWGPPRRFSLNGGLSRGKYPVTQAGYIPIRKNGELDISSERSANAVSDVIGGYGQRASGPRPCHVPPRIWAGVPFPEASSRFVQIAGADVMLGGRGAPRESYWTANPAQR